MKDWQNERLFKEWTEIYGSRYFTGTWMTFSAWKKKRLEAERVDREATEEKK